MSPVSAKVGNRQRQFEAMVRAHTPDLYRFARWLCSDDARAQDLVQETLLRAWRAIGSLRDGAAIKPWLLTILRREHARGFERKAFDLTELDDGIPDEVDSGPEGAGSDAQVRAAILKLEPKYREPLLMQALGGFSCEEIARELGSKPGAVMTQLFRARQKLRALLEDATVGDAKEAGHGLP